MQDVIPYTTGNQQRRLGTAEWMHPDQISERYPYKEGDFWLGRNLTDATPIGFNDDRHICLVSGNRGGKGTTTIIPNIALWPGSLVVIDPKGENASVMAARRGKGSKYCEGMGQRVFVLDPFTQATVDDTYRACYNPLDVVDPDSPEAIDEAGRIADALVVTGEGKDPHWEESARAVVKALILHVVTYPDYEGERSLTTVRKLLMQGDKPMIAAMKKKGIKNIPSAQVVLWDVVRRNQAIDGLISSMGENYFDMVKTSPKEYNSVRSVAVRNTEFIDSPGMKKMLSRSDFQLSELKTDSKGVSVFLTLPQRYMNTHFRWLRMMISLVTTEMEKTREQPATGHRVLMCLDEFAGLRRMEIIENAVAQIAGYGVKLFFVLQSLEQLKAVYPERWQTFLNNTSLKIFYSIDGHFTREYVSNLLGEQEIIRTLQTQSQADGTQETNTTGTSTSNTETTTNSQTAGTSTNIAKTKGRGSNESHDSGAHAGNLFNIGGLASDFITNAVGGNVKQHWGGSKQKSKSRSTGTNKSFSEATATGTTAASNESLASGQTQTATTGTNETIQKRALITPDEMGRIFTRQEDTSSSLYPGVALVLVSGQNPIILRKTNYFEDAHFIRKFDPHPDHKFVPYVDPIAIEDEAPKTLTYEDGIALIESMTPNFDPHASGTPEVMRALNKLYPATSKIADIYNDEKVFELPLELIWYKVLDFENYIFWQYGSQLYLPPLPNPFCVGTNLNVKRDQGALDRSGNPFFRMVLDCSSENNAFMKSFSIYTGYGYKFNLTKITNTKTMVNFTRMGYVKSSKFLFLFQKENLHDELSSAEFNKFYKYCMSEHEYPKIIQPWVKSILSG